VSKGSARQQTESSVSKGYEQQDVNVGRLAAFGIGMGVVTVAFFLAAWVLFGRFAAREAGRTQRISPLTEAIGRRLPPSPRLEPNLPGRLAELHRRENAVLSSYGWADRGSGIIRIPIERAMDLLVDRLAQAPPEQSEETPAGNKVAGGKDNE